MLKWLKWSLRTDGDEVWAKKRFIWELLLVEEPEGPVRDVVDKWVERVGDERKDTLMTWI
jgi:hypothetical protein